GFSGHLKQIAPSHRDRDVRLGMAVSRVMYLLRQSLAVALTPRCPRLISGSGNQLRAPSQTLQNQPSFRRSGDKRAQEHAFGPMVRTSFAPPLDTLGEDAQVVAASIRIPLCACLANVLRAWGGDRRPEPFDRTLGPLCLGTAPIADGLELGNALLQHRVAGSA